MRIALIYSHLQRWWFKTRLGWTWMTINTEWCLCANIATNTMSNVLVDQLCVRLKGLIRYFCCCCCYCCLFCLFVCFLQGKRSICAAPYHLYIWFFNMIAKVLASEVRKKSYALNFQDLKITKINLKDLGEWQNFGSFVTLPSLTDLFWLFLSLWI